MAFRELVETECGSSNPLIHLTSHYVQDHGFKEQGIHQPFNSSETFQTPDADQLVQQFLEEPTCPQTFRMDNLLQEMKKIDQNIHTPETEFKPMPDLRTDLERTWEEITTRSLEEIRANKTWNEEITKEEKEEDIHFTTVREYGLNPQWAEDFLECNTNTMQNDTNISKDNTAQIKENEDPNFTYSKFMKFMEQESEGILIETNSLATNLNEMSKDWIEQFETDNNSSCVINSTNDDTVLNKVEEELEAAGTWVGEFTKENSVAEREADSLWKRFQDEWDKIFTSDGLSSTHPWVSEFDTYYDPFNKEYEFSETNPMKDLPNALAEGKRRLEAGDLPSAVLCFEAAAQQDENSVEAWLLLGKTQAENEQDPLAISALNHCLCLDPSNSVALMALAASYANESYHKQACLTLKEWLLKNEKYKHLAKLESNLTKEDNSNFDVSTLYDKIYDEVNDLYIQAARINPRNEIDADVQCGLGILFNLSNDYNKAVDCFQAALQVRPDDSRLWNRLGATLANGQRSAEAVNAYHHALELSPGFIRARYNLGISCVNLGAYKEAGEHLLTALNQQAAGRGLEGSNVPSTAMSNTIWSTLRLVISLMHKYELLDAIQKRDLSTLNREFEVM